MGREAGGRVEGSGVLAHLAYRFKVPKETLATAALCHLVQGSEVLRAAVAGLAAGQTARVLERVRFEAERTSAQDKARPDIEGRAGEMVLVQIEGKFEAGLTEHQPVTYLRRLSPGGTLLFVCPGWRVRDVLAEATQRAAAGGFAPVGGPRTDEQGVRWQDLGQGRRLAVVGWLALLDWLAACLPPGHESLGDVRQVRGLAARFEGGLMEWTKSQLVQPEESGFGRLFQLGYHAANEASDILRHHPHVADAKLLGWREVTTPFYRTKAQVGAVRLFIGFSPSDWGRPCPTPLAFVVSKYGLTASQKDAAYAAYRTIMGLVDARLGGDFDGWTFGVCEESDEFWWGPVPLAFAVPELEVRADLEKTIDAIVAELRQVPQI